MSSRWAALLLIPGLAVFAPEAAAGPPPVPDPIVVAVGNGEAVQLVRYRLSVVNFRAFPEYLFGPAEGLPPCPDGDPASRLQVRILAGGEVLSTVCSLSRAEVLSELTLDLPADRIRPARVVVELIDVLEGRTYGSGPVNLVDARSSVPQPAVASRGAGGVEGGSVEPAGAKTEVHRIGGEVTAPVAVSQAQPRYPEEARTERIQGTVIIEAIIGKDGVPRDARVLRGPDWRLAEAALEAIQQWRFRPGTREGRAVDVYFTLTVNFRLN